MARKNHTNSWKRNGTILDRWNSAQVAKSGPKEEKPHRTLDLQTAIADPLAEMKKIESQLGE